MKTRIITWLVTIGAFLNTFYAILSENEGLLAQIGVSEKLSKIIMLIGLLWAAFSRSLKEPKTRTVSATDGGGAGVPGKGL